MKHARWFSRLVLPALLLTAGAVSTVATGQEWTRFRGPNGAGISECDTIPVTWTDDDYNWQVALPGTGHSSPVLWGERIFLTSAEDDGAVRIVLCLSAENGELLWQRRYPSTPHKKHVRNSFATPTPAVDADHVYVAWSAPEEYTFLALDHQGNDVWRRNLGPYESQHSCGTSPIVFEDMVVLGNEQDGDSFLIAVDRQTGSTRWQTPREPSRVAYSTPCIFQPEQGPLEMIFNSGSHGIYSVDPWSGRPNWELKVFTMRSVSSPVIVGDIIYGSCGSGAGGNYVVALRHPSATASGEPEEAYRVDRSAPYVPTVVAHGPLVFLMSDGGVATCIEAESGEVVWRHRVGNNFSASPIRVQDRLYCVADDGEVLVLAATRDYEILGRMHLNEESRSTPAVAGGRLYLRTISHLYSLGGKE